jgi:hypothetical protein
VSPQNKAQIRKEAVREKAKSLLASIASGDLETYVGYRQLYGIWTSSNAAVPELRPLFGIPGVEPDGALSVTDDFRSRVLSIVREVLNSLEGCRGSSRS